MDYTFIRKRFIPEEEVDISGDEVLYDDGALIVTRWLPIRARNDIGWGFSDEMARIYFDICFRRD